MITGKPEGSAGATQAFSAGARGRFRVAAEHGDGSSLVQGSDGRPG